MEHNVQPYRSVLYMPGSRPRALEKARTLAADALILDLEDAVAPAEKPRARDLVGEAVEAGGYGARRLIVRINALDTEWGLEDLERTCAAGPDAILLPKVEKPAHILRLADLMEANGAPVRTRIWAMMETPRAMLNAPSVAGAHPRLEGFVMGTNDLVKDLGAAHTPDRTPLLASLGLCLLAARAEGLICVDGVYNAFQDQDGLRAACVQGRDMGFDGKTLIHPGQIDAANAAYTPPADEIARARKIMGVFDLPENANKGVVQLDGQMVERLHVEMAKRTIAIADAIAALKAS